MLIEYSHQTPARYADTLRAVSPGTKESALFACFGTGKIFDLDTLATAAGLTKKQTSTYVHRLRVKGLILMKLTAGKNTRGAQYFVNPAALHFLNAVHNTAAEAAT